MTTGCMQVHGCMTGHARVICQRIARHVRKFMHCRGFAHVAHDTSSIAASNVSCQPTKLPALPFWFLAQASAVGVWGTPLEVACHAADIVTARPTAQLLQERYSSGHPTNIHADMLTMTQEACRLLNHKHVVSPYMPRERLLGRWCDVWQCDRSCRFEGAAQASERSSLYHS
jgi:hypothetical protein